MNTRNDHRFVTLSLSVLAIGGIGMGIGYMGAPTPEPVPASHVVEVTPTPTTQSYTVPASEPRACLTEDEVPASGDCIWWADTMGNGEGLSFVAHEDGSVTYIDTPERVAFVGDKL